MPSSPESFRLRLIRHWYRPDSAALGSLERWLIAGLSAIYGVLWGLRRLWLAGPGKPGQAAGIRVIAVGNLVVGGAGKTPCSIAIGTAMRTANVPCGLIFRGYRSEAESGSVRVVEPGDLDHTPASAIGDEAWLACWRTSLPIAVGRDRFKALAALRAAHPELKAVILDDGLQQATLAVDHKLLVTDARGFGNGKLLPAGPLREPIGDLQRFDAWIHQESAGTHQQSDLASRWPMPQQHSLLKQSEVAWVPVTGWQAKDQWLALDAGIQQFKGKKILAAAGIAVPERFFQLLESYGLTFERLPLEDHDPQTVQRIAKAQASGRHDLILMTEKDAVKFFVCDAPLPADAWALRRDARLDDDFLKRLIDGLQTS